MAGVTTSTTRLANREAQQHLSRKANALRFAWQDTSAYEHAIAFTVAKMMDADLLAETRAAVQDALDNGTDFATFKKRLKPYLMARGWWGQALMGNPDTGEIKKVHLGSTRRLRTIYHTNLHTAYAAGQWERIQANKATQPYLKYIGSDAAEPREAHKRFYGMILPVDDPFWVTHMPPNGWGCRCNVRALTKAQAEREGISESPRLTTVEVINKRTGEVTTRPGGVDTSFAHNPGDRLGALVKIAENKHGEGFADTLMDELAAHYMQRAVSLKPEVASRIVSHALQNADFRGMVNAPYQHLLDILAEGGHAPRTLINIGIIPPNILQAMREAEMSMPQSAVIAVTEERLKHAAGEKSGAKPRKTALTYEELRRLPDILHEPYAVYRAVPDKRGKEALIFVYSDAETAEKYLVTLDYQTQAMRPNAKGKKDWDEVVTNVFNTAAKVKGVQKSQFGTYRALWEKEREWWR